MLKEIEINTRLSEKLKIEIERFLSESKLKDPVPGLLWGKERSDTEMRFLLGGYERDELPVNDPVRINIWGQSKNSFPFPPGSIY